MLAVLAAVVVFLHVSPERALAHGPTSAASLPSDASQRAEALTRALASASTQLATASTAERTRLEQTLLATATTRRQLLLALIESDPATVLRLAVAASVRSALPPSVSAQLEEEARLEGTLEIFHEDAPAGARYLYGLHTAGTRYSLHFASDEPTHLLTGATIRVRGIKLDTMLALAGGGNNVQTVAAAPAPSTFGEQRTLVMLVNFADNSSQPWSRDQATQVIFGTLDAFIRENSYGAAWVTGNVSEWLTIPLSSSVCDVMTLAKQATQAAETAGLKPADYPRWVFVFPKNACGFAGASFIGGSPSHAWLNGTLSLRVAGHEFGHGLGLWHSHSLDCGSVAIGPSCTTSEYGDTLDVMGTSAYAHFNAFQKERVGWLNSGVAPAITTVETEGTYVLEPYALAGSGAKALKIQESIDATTGKRTWYYVEYRQAIGFDAELATHPNATAGVIVRIGSESSGDSSYLLDMTPESASYDWRDPALMVGQTFQDAAAGVTLTLDAATETGAAVTVRLAAVTTAPTDSTVSTDPPAVTIATDQPSYTLNQAISITTTVSAGGSPLAGAAVTFTVVKASGSTVKANATTGSDGTASYKLRLKRQDPVGTYQVGVTASRDSLSGSAATSFTVRSGK